jgi:hypothetical protein
MVFKGQTGVADDVADRAGDEDLAGGGAIRDPGCEIEGRA